MVAALARRVARKSRRPSHRMISREARRRLFIESLEDRRLLAGLDESLVTEHSSLVTGHSSLVTGPSAMTRDQGPRTTDYASVRRELVIIDAAAPDYRQLVQDVIENPEGTRQVDVLLIDSATDGVAAMGQILGQYRDLDAVHLISHGSPGQIRLGNAVLSARTLAAYGDSIRGWAGALRADADILVYGCDVAAGAAGASLVDQLAALTGADVAASDDLTGQAARGGDWDLEVAAGRIEANIAVGTTTRLAWAGLLAPQPAVTVNMPAAPFIGEDVNFTVVFANDSSNPADAGYGPFVDLIFPVNGADGDLGALPPEAQDGLTFSTASYLGIDLVATEFIFEDDGSGFGCVDHPYAVDATGAKLEVCGPAGDQLVVLELPFGSFVPDQPEVTINVSATMPNLADLGHDLTVFARGGFRYGADPLDNPSAPDPTILTAGSDGANSTSWVDRDSSKPVVMTMTKRNNAPESETATGPNYRRTWTLSVSIADDQVIRNLDIIDGLPNNVVVENISFAFPTDPLATVSNIPATPFGPTYFNFASGQLRLGTVNSVTGSGGADVVVTVAFYVPEFDAEGDRIIPLNGEDDIALVGGTVLNSQSPNDSYALGDWTPIDTRDLGATDNAFAQPVAGDYDDILDDKSIAIQKGVRRVQDQTPPGYSPGDTLEYTLEFQISDYYTYGDLVITDTYQDGQNLAAFTPTFEVTDRYGTVSGSFALNSTYTHTNNDSTSGTETLVFFVSQALLAAGAADGILEGGATHGELDTAVNAAARGTIRFRTVIQEEYAQSPPSTDKSVDQGDLINNSTLRIDGSVRENYENDVDGNRFNVIYANENDNSSAGVTIIRGDVVKTIYAVNGSKTLPNPVEVAPGDTITYLIGYDLAISDFEKLRLTDFLPLPVFDVENPDANATPGPGWTFDLTHSFDAVPPPAGVVEFAPTDTFFNSNSPASNIVPTIGIDGVANSIYLDYDNYDSPQSTATRIRLLVTVTVTDDPFADGLFLTNIVRATEQNSFIQSQVADQIIQIRLGQPVLNLQKGVVASTGPDRLFTPAAVAPAIVSAPGSTGFRFEDTINSTDLGLTPIDSDLSNVDAGDLVTFAVIVENTGSSHRGAFDVRISDALPSGFAIPSGGAGLNLHVSDGTGEPIGYTELGDGGGDDLFGAGIELTDPGPTEPTVYGSDGGAIDRYDANNGRNLVVITYDLVALPTVSPREVLTNTASVDGYAGTEGGENHVQADLPASRLAELSDDARVTIIAPEADKSLVGTSVVSGPNENDEAVIGETVQYEVVLTLIEGQMHLSNVVDTLDLGLRFVSLDSITPSGGDVTTTRGAGNFSDLATFAPSTTGNGATQAQTLTFNFGTLRNANTNNATDETLTVRYTVQVLNIAGNQGAGPTELNNSAVVNWDVDGNVGTTNDVQALPPVSAELVTVIEPELQIDKSVVVGAGGTIGDAGDTVTYTIVVEHTAESDTDAFDVTFLDPLPISAVNVVFATGVTVEHSTLGSIKAAFELVGGQLRTRAGQAFDLAVGETVTITVVGTLRSDVVPLQTVNNTGTIQWTSLDGSVPEERTGTESPALNDYTAEDSASFAVRNINVVKSVKATSEGHTPDGQLAIGEIIRYRLQTTLPEGTSPSFTVTDLLPSGLQFLDGTATLAFVSSSDASITADGPYGINAVAAWVDSDGTLIGEISPAYAIPEGAIAPSSFTDGTDPVFSLGKLTNLDSDADLEYVIIEFNALVLNAATARDGEFKGNSYQVQVGTNTPVTSNTVTSRIVEPSITNVDKSVVTLPADADDTVRYRVTYTNTGTATAFDVRLEDQLPAADLDLNEAGVTVSFSGLAPFPTAVNHSVNDMVDVRIGQLPAGVTVTVEYTATLRLSGINPGEMIPNVANVTYTSLPGTGTQGNPTGSNTPGGSGASTGERSGTPDPADENDYLDSDDASFTVQSPAFVKTIVETSEAHTSGTDVAIGEIVRYRLRVRVPEATMPDFRITDALPSGLQFLNDGTTKLALVSNEANFTSTGGINTSSAPGAGVSGNQDTVGSIRPSYVLPAGAISPATGSVFTSGIDPVFRLGELVNRDTDDDEEFVVIEFNALVLNATNNDAFSTTSGSYRKDNTATLAVGPTFTYSSNTVAATIREPAIIDVDKSRVGSEALDAGDVVTYRVTFSNSGNADAFEVVVRDVLDATYFANVTVTSVTIEGAAASYDASGTGGNILNVVLPLLDDDSLNDNVVVEFRATLTSNVRPNQTVPNTVFVTYTSLPGIGTRMSTPGVPTANTTGSDTDGGSGAPDGERDGSGSPGQNDYADSDSVAITTKQPTFVKTAPAALTSESSTGDSQYTPDTDLAIGETVTFNLSVTLPDGWVDSLVVVDNLPSTASGQLQLVSASVFSIGSDLFADVGHTTPLAPGAIIVTTASNQATFTFPASFYNRPDTGGTLAADNQIVVRVVAVVPDVAANVSGDTLTNAAQASYRDGQGVTRTLSSSANVDLVEPVLSIAKDASVVAPATVNGGDTIVFTIAVDHTAASRADAFDVVISDTLPVGLTYAGGLTALNGPLPGVVQSGQLLTFTWASLPQAPAAGRPYRFSFQARVDASVTDGDTFTNTANLAYDTLPGIPASGVQRSYSGSDPAGVITADVEPRNLDKSLVATSETHTSDLTSPPQVAIGEIVRYRIQVDLDEGTHPDLRLVDTLPLGLTLVDDGEVTLTLSSTIPMGVEAGLNPGVTDPLPAGRILRNILPGGQQQITFDLGDLTNNDQDGNIERVSIEYNVLVGNNANTNAGQLKTNSAAVTVAGFSYAAADTVSVQIVEPSIASVVKRRVGTAPVDAYDAVTYEVEFRNTGNADAFEVRVHDALDAALFTNVTVTSVTRNGVVLNPPADYTNSSGANILDLTIRSLDDFNSPVVIVRFTAELTGAVQPNQTIPNTADVTYTSLPGTGSTGNPTGSVTPGGSGASDGERNGNDGPGGLNDYRVQNSVDFTLGQPGLAKSINTTSNPHTALPEVTIGEIVTYQVVLTVPEGTTHNAIVVDTVTPGLSLVDIVSITANGPVTSSLGFAAVEAAAETGLGTNQSSVTLNFGTLTNAAVNDGDAETITVLYRAVVRNTAGNAAGRALDNSAAFTWTGGGAPLTATAPDLRVVEPVMTVAKSANPLVGDAGDVITFTLDIANVAGVNGATALDVVLSDLIPAHTTYVPGSAVYTGGVGGVAPNVPIIEPAGELTVRWDVFPEGGVSQIQFQVTLNVTVGPGLTVTNTAELDWTSLPGDPGQQSANDPLSVERTGDPTDPGLLENDYHAEDAVAVGIFNPSLSKLIVSTSELGTSGSNLVIGEIVRYRMYGSIVEGSLNDLVLRDVLPPGLALLNDGQIFIGFIANNPMTLEGHIAGAQPLAAPPPTFAFPSNHILVDGSLLPAPNPGDPVVLGRNVAFDIGSVVNNDNDADTEYGVLEFNVIVLNTEDNDAFSADPADYTKNNQFELDYVIGGVSQTATSDIVTATIVEPRITNVTKTLTTSPYDAGDVATYEVTFTNTGNGPAYDVHVKDMLPAWLDLILGPPTSVVVSPAAGVTHNSVGNTVDLSIAVVPAGGSVTVRYSATLIDTIPSNTLVENEVDVTYTSLPGTGTAANPTGTNTPGASGDMDGERNGSGVLPNDYLDSDGVEFITITPSVDKSVSATSFAGTGAGQLNPAIEDVTIGETVTYRMVITLPEGTTQVRLTDTLPSVLTVVSSAVVSIGGTSTAGATAGTQLSVSTLSVGAAGVASDFNPIDTWSDRVVFDFGTVTNLPDGFSNGLDQIVVEVVALVRDVIDNADADRLRNVAVLDYGEGTDEDTVDVEIVEPLLAIDKSAAPVDGRSVRYTVRVADPSPTAAAYNVAITDLLADPGITLVPGSVAITGATTVPGGGNIVITTGNGGSDTTVRIDVTTFPLGGVLVFTYDAILTEAGNQSSSIDNTADLDWWSLPGNTGRHGTDADDERLGAIGDRVWYDDDRDGVQDVSEDGIAGVAVELVWGGLDGLLATPGDNLTLTTVTDVNGNYQFSGLPAGEYRVTATEPVDTSPTYDADAPFDGISEVTLAVGQVNRLQDFGYVRLTSTIGDRVWLDEDADGVQDAGEDGIANVAVELVGDTNGDGTPDTVIATTVTGADGGYLFHDLPPGDYTVQVDATSLPAGLRNRTYDEDDGTAAPDGQTDVTLGPGQEYVTADFGYNWAPSSDVNSGTNAGAIGDRVWIDTDGDGVQDPDEIGLENVTVTLRYDSDGDGDIDAPYPSGIATTDATGNYLFDDLPAGIYEVVVTPPAGYAQTGDPDGTLDHRTTAPVVLAPGDVYVNADFGYRPTTTPTGSIGDTVWFEADADGTYEPGIGEYGIAGVSVSLIQDSDGDGTWDAGEPVIATVVTDENGRYLFAGLPVTDGAGTDDYLVWVSDTANVLDGLQQTFDDDGVVTAGLSAVTDLTTTAVTDQDFGYAAPDANRLDGENGVIGDTIFIDFDADNAFDVGEGREGVTVNLYDSTGTTLLATTATDENGRYYFADLNTALDYLVVVPASNFVAGGALAGTNNTVDPNGDNNNLSLVTTFTNGANLLQDFGYRPVVPNAIGGTIWADTDADGTLEGGESARFEGVTVVLLDDEGNIVAATTTAGNGTYLFSGLPNGTYTVDVTDEANVLAGWWHSDGPNDNADNNSQNDPYTVSVAGGQLNTTGDFGYFVEPAAVGNFVWDDLDGDGIQDDGEPGIPGTPVTLRITYPNGSVVTLVDVTEADGSYSFENLLQDEDYDGQDAGEPSFVVSVAVPVGYLTSPVNAGTPNNDATDSDNHAGQPVTLVRGETNETIDFGLCRPVTIGNFVWEDVNGNGVQDDGVDSGISGVTLTLTGTTGGGVSVNRTTTTDGDGLYEFTNLPPGTYGVTVTPPDGFVATATGRGTTGTDSNPSPSGTTPVTLPGGGSDTTLDFGFYEPVTIGNFVWNDLNGNGQQDSGEPGINGVSVTVSGTTGAGAAFSETTTTAGNGGYLFTDLPPGTYQVTFTNLPAGMVFTTANLGNDATDSDAVGGATASVTLASGGQNLTLDAGLYTPARLGNFVWNDLNGNGQQDALEPGINGVTVTVSGTTGAGVAFSETTTTAGNGGYLFTDLPPGTYQVTFTNLPAGMVFTTANLGNDATDSDAVGGATASVTLASGGENLTLDGGLYTPVRLGDFVWNDLNGNGIQDDGVNSGIPGVSLTLTGTTGAGASVSLTTISGVGGQYEFANLPPGTYRVSATPPIGFVATATGRGTAATDSNSSPSETTPSALPSGGSDATIDFGFYEPATLGDLVWNDTNANGQLDFEESGLAGVVVNLYRPGYGADGIPGNADDAGVMATRTTPASGVYSFTNLPPGTYLVDFVPPAGYIFSPQNRGDDNTDSDADFGTGQTPLVTLAAGEENNTLDAGLVPVLGAIGNRVWLDEDGDGLQDAGEAGIGGLTVRLTPPAGVNLGAGAGQPITTVTGTDGGYLFPDLPAGQYTVTVLPTAGLNQTGDPDATLNNTTTVILAAGQEIVTADFGYNWVPRTDSTNPAAAATGAIGDRIWNDANGDGVQDPGETGFPGITVRLLRDTNGDGIYGGAGDTGTLTTTTDVRGQYIFDGIAPGAYVIDVNTAGLPAGWSPIPTGDPDGDGDTTTEPIIIAPGDVYLRGDFGFAPSPAAVSYTIGDQVFVDIDGDGVLDAGEPVIPGVTVNLLNGSGQVLATTVTDENGQYQFPDLATTPGTVFTVQVTDTNHVLGELAPISDPDGTLDNRTTVTIVAGTTDYPTADFGYAPPGHAAGDGLIGSTVFLDRDGNGAYTPGEGIEGVTVWLYDSTATTLLGTTATDENGNYYFGGLDPDGAYRVIVDAAGIPGGAQSMVNPPGSPGPSQGQVNLAVDPDNINLEQDFGYGYIAPDSSAGDITGVVWGDPSADGTRDGTELGRYGNVEVVLRDSDGNVVGTTTTDSNGFYSFLNVPPGSYTVDVVENGPVLDGLWHSTGVNSQVDPAPVAVEAGGVYTLDFGYYAEPAAIGDRVWVDTNGNGIQDTDSLGDFLEPGIPDVPVTLRITYPNGAVTTVVTRTDLDGNYLFPNLLLDETFDGLGVNEPTYTVSMATPTGMTPTGIGAAGSTATNDSNNPAGTAATVTEGQTNATLDFGFRYIGSLSGVVYSNTDSDLVRDPGEAGMSGVTVYLDSNNNGALDPGEPTTTTNSSGQYTFSYLPPGTYYVRQLVPNGNSQTAPLSDAALVEDLALGEVATGLNFGNTPPPGTILDDGDPGVTYPGWAVSFCPLFFNADGRYLCNAAGTMTWNFSGLAAGVYRVSTTWLAGSAFTNAATYQVSTGSGTTTAGPYSQQLPPSSYPGYSASGYYWADLTTAITVSASGTLTVSLAAPATGCVNGDAVRIMPVTTPEITVLNGTAALTDGSSTVNMGSTGGSPITYTFTVRNDGGGTLNLGSLSVPADFTSTGPALSSLASGASTTFTVTLPASLAAGTYSGQVVLGNNDNSEAPFNFTLQGTVGGGSPTPQPSAPAGAPPPSAPAPAATIDVSQGGTALANGISTVDFGSVTVGAAASRTFTVTNTSTLDVELATPSLPAAGFSVTQGYGDASLAPGQSTTFVVSLVTAAEGTFSDPTDPMVLSTTGGAGLFSVLLTGTVTPAAVPTATKAIIDDGDAGFTAGGFTTYSASSGYLGDVRYATQNTVETKVAQWQFSLPGLGLADGLYRVSTLWYVESSRASQATFKMYNGAASGTPQTTAVVNQQVAPRADVVDEGRNWQDLGVVLVSGGVLTVTISDLAVGGAVVADAVRIERVVAPEIQVVLDATGADLVDGSGVVNFGSVFAGSTSQLTLRVKNVGAGTVTLSAPTLTGTGFTLVSGPASTSLSANDGAAGGADETTITLAINTSVAGSKSGTLALVNSDANENPFDLTLQGTVSSVKIIDDGDSGFVQSGPSAWLTWADGYQGDLRYSAKNAGRTATWTFTDLPAGTYRVSATWVRNSNRATNSPYTISDGGGTVLVNQELAPNHSSFTWLLESGKYFADLRAGVSVSDGTLTVSLTDVGANEYVVADAVRIERVSPLLASAGAEKPQSAVPALESVPAQTVTRAIAYWAAEDVAAAAKLSAATILVADLPERHLGLASPVTNTVWLDADAAGYGWELGSGPSSVVSGEGAGNRQAGGVDLWHVLTHEFGHLLGLGDLDADEHAGERMASELSPEPWRLPVLSTPGVRRLELSDLAWDGGDLLSLQLPSGTGVGGDAADEVRSAVTRLTTRRASEAALLAWAADEDDDDDEVLTALRRDDEDEHTGRVDRVFEASGDWDLAPLAWATEDRPRDVEQR